MGARGRKKAGIDRRDGRDGPRGCGGRCCTAVVGARMLWLAPADTLSKAQVVTNAQSLVHTRSTAATHCVLAISQYLILVAVVVQCAFYPPSADNFFYYPSETILSIVLVYTYCDRRYTHGRNSTVFRNLPAESPCQCD